MLKNKKILLGLILLSCLILLSGCYKSETTFNIDKEGMAHINFTVRAKKHMAGDEANTFHWTLINTFPELKENYTITKKTETIDYSTYIFYNYESKDKVDINKNENISFTEENGKYTFNMEIPALIESADESSKDDTVFTIEVVMPEEIDMANTQFKGRRATWNVSKENLTSTTTLKVFTK